MKLAVQVLTFNDAVFLPHCLRSLAGQTDRDWELHMRDQSTRTEDALQVESTLRNMRDDLTPQFEAGENLGFAGGHQKLFSQHSADLVLLVNVDTVLAPTFVADVRRAFEADDRLGAATGQIYRWSLDGDDQILTNEIDSLGLKKKYAEQVEDVRTRNVDAADSLNTFGISGCLPMYRREALASTDPEGRLFDPGYHSYKEDIDVAYRLGAKGWGHAIVPEATAYHHRTFKPGARATVSSWAQRQSYRNHLWNLIVHLQAKDWLTRGWVILPYELAKAGYLLLRSPNDVLQAWKETRAYLPVLRARKRFLYGA